MLIYWALGITLLVADAVFADEQNGIVDEPLEILKEGNVS